MMKVILGVILLAIDGTEMFLFKRFPDFFFPAYRNLSKSWMTFLNSLTNFLKFSLWDIIALFLGILFINTFIKAIRKRRIIKWFINVFLVVSIFISIAINGWLLNHYAPSLSGYIDLDVKEYSVSELSDACEYYLLKASDLAVQMDRDDDMKVIDYDFYEIGELAGKSYKTLGNEYDVFKGSDARVKRFSIIGDYLLYNDIVGMFMPLSGEASVPYNVARIQLPYYMCHEAAHRLGLASEQEANFAAFMACIENDDIRFKYSGYYMAFSYCYSSLYRVNPEMAKELYEKYSEDEKVKLLRYDRSIVSQHYEKYQSSLKEVSDKINDTYLKTFSQEDGIQSYGMVTDYLIAYYKKY